ncbi:hypothetical protein D9758_006271 [Tetrapyrgos nigripes]|uniref:Uncharacterized protein n=1 Tax=Tetrapyrgos nigripes TaxID=182062 RepID=A0A8H5GAM5_9AGAR|nr:hypothetical protein D9758_006271 [Tetrapyrgos nigripes]
MSTVITSFDLAARDIEQLCDLHWSCIIIDEVHRIKNDKSKGAQAFSKFTCLRRYGLTGTAIQNSYDELWAIANWTTPGLLCRGKEWKQFVSKPLRVGQSSKASEDQRSKHIASTLQKEILPVFFLRRTKDLIKDQLPQKIDQIVFCPLAKKQRSAYKRILQIPEVLELIAKDDPCECGSGKKRKKCCSPWRKDIDGAALLRYMSILLQLSNHLALILPGAPTDTDEQHERYRALARDIFPKGPPVYGTAVLAPDFCGKWTVLDSLLHEWRQDRSNKVLIFSKSVKLLNMLEFHIQKSFRNVRLDGATPQHQRMALVDKFQTDPEVFIFLISTLAGGTGLNLTSANKVVVFDPHWNPAHDLQAMDRAFRIGQTRDVHVFRLLGAGALEELIYARQIYKQQQMAIGYNASFQTRYFEGVQNDPTRKGELFGIQNILKLHEGMATKEAIEKAQTSELTWALSNMTAGSSYKGDQLAEPDSKSGDDMLGLQALMFDDDVPQAENERESEVYKVLNSMYTHRNDALIAPSRVEAERAKAIRLKNKGPPRQRARKSDNAANTSISSEPNESPHVWPPVRSHHKRKKPDPEQLMRARLRALIKLRRIKSEADLPRVAQEFAQHSPKEQEEMIDRIRNAELREVELWENERCYSQTAARFAGVVAAANAVQDANATSSRKRRKRLNPTLTPQPQDTTHLNPHPSYSSNPTFSLAPGWKFIETEDWRVDYDAGAGGVGATSTFKEDKVASPLSTDAEDGDGDSEEDEEGGGDEDDFENGNGNGRWLNITFKAGVRKRTRPIGPSHVRQARQSQEERQEQWEQQERKCKLEISFFIVFGVSVNVDG